MPEDIKKILSIDKALLFLSEKRVPIHRHTFWYLFGGLALFLIIIQFLTGMLLLVYYSPTPGGAYESIDYITTRATFGWFLRTIHHWSANLLIVVVLIHLASTFFMKAYRQPRQFTWISGVITLFILFGFCFTGSLLPWDTTAYFATQIGTEIPRSLPIIGNFLTHLLRGSDFIGEESLKRFSALHVSILPMMLIGFTVIHLILNQIHGTSVPVRTGDNYRTVPFYPSFLYRDLLSWTLAGILLVWICLIFPIIPGAKADPYSSAPVGIKPEWYFLPFYETLRLFPSTIFSLNGEMVVNMFVGLFGFVLVAVPFIDRKAIKGEVSRVPDLVGVILLCYFVISIILAYTT